MKLSVELFRKTVEQLRGGSITQRPEKRATPRAGLRCKIHLSPIRGGVLGPAIEAWTRDISRVGLGIMSARKIKLGDHYLLSVPHEDADDAEKPLALYCTVRSCHELAADIYAIGLSFEDLRNKQAVPAAGAPDREPPAQPQSPAPSADEERIRKAILG
jgi:hypothetical protein